MFLSSGMGRQKYCEGEEVCAVGGETMSVVLTTTVIYKVVATGMDYMSTGKSSRKGIVGVCS